MPSTVADTRRATLDGVKPSLPEPESHKSADICSSNSIFTMETTVVQNAEAERRTPWTRMHTLLLGGVLLAYVLIAWQSIHAPLFVLDDGAELAYIRSHPSLGDLFRHDCFLFFRPVKNLCFLAFDALLPLGITACRLLVVVLGLVCAMAVLALFRRLLRTPLAALAATACWLLAPTLVTVTAWLSGVNILLMSGLAAVAMGLYLEARARTGLPGMLCLVGAWLTTLLAMFCYEGAICLPVLFVMVDWFLYPERVWTRRSWQVYVALGSVLLVYLLLRSLRATEAQQTQCLYFGELTNGQVAAAAPWFLFQHLAAWFWPFGRQAALGSYFQGEASPLLLRCAWLGAVALAVGCLLLRRRLAMVALGVAWCLVAFLPMSNILAFRNGPYGDYYLTLASMGLALAFGWSIGALAAYASQARSVLLVLVALSFWRLAAVGESMAWSYAWNDSGALLRRTLETFPGAFSAMNEYARLQFSAGNHEECQAWTDRALALAPHNRGSFELRALVAERRGNVDLARKELDRFMQYGGTNDSWGWYFQGYLLDERLGDTNGAIRCYEQAVARRVGWSPDVLDSMNALAYFAVQRGDRRTAIALWEQIIQADPGRSPVRQNLVRAYSEAGEKDKARQHWMVLQEKR